MKTLEARSRPSAENPVTVAPLAARLLRILCSSMVARDWPRVAPAYQAVLAQSGLMKVSLSGAATAALEKAAAPARAMAARKLRLIFRLMFISAFLFGDLVIAQRDSSAGQHAAVQQGGVVAGRDGSGLAQDRALEDAVGAQGGGAHGHPEHVFGIGTAQQRDDRIGRGIEGHGGTEDVFAVAVEGQRPRHADGAGVAVHAGWQAQSAQVDIAGEADVAGTAVGIGDGG